MTACAVANCGREVLRDKLMCLKHWRRVPFVVQLDVYRAWAVLKSARMPNRKLAAARKYREARDKAIKAVAA